MSRLGFFVAKTADLAPPVTIPARRLDRLQQSFRRRLCDSIEEVFHRACIGNDLQTANDLYAIMEDIHRHGAATNGKREQRIGNEALVRARDMLERCRELANREPCTEPPLD